MKTKFLALGAVLLMCMTAFAGVYSVSDSSDAGASTYGSSANPLTSVNYTLAFDGADAGSVWYVRTGSYVTFHAFEDGGGLDEFGSYIRNVSPSNAGLDSDGCGRLVKPGTVTLNCTWWNGANGSDFTLTVIGVGDEYFPHTLHYNANGGSGSCSDTVVWSPSSGNVNVTAGSGYGFTKQGYYVQSWNTAANGSGTSYAVGAGVPVSKNGSVTLYAQWAVDDRNGTASNPLTSLNKDVTWQDRNSTFYVEVGSYVDLKGWGEEPEGVTWHSGTGLGLTSYISGGFEYDAYGLHGTINQTGTLQTTWWELEDPEGNYSSSFTLTIIAVKTTVTHTVHFDGNGNTGGTMADTVVTDRTNGNIDISLPSCGFVRTGYGFAGWKVGNTVYQPGENVSVGADATVTAVAQWSENTLTGSANNLSAVSGLSYSNQIGATASNGGSLSYAVKSCTGGTATVNTNGKVTYSAPSVSSTVQYTVTVTVTASYPDGSSLSRDVSFTVTVDPVLSFTNAATSGTLSVKGA